MYRHHHVGGTIRFLSRTVNGTHRSCRQHAPRQRWSQSAKIHGIIFRNPRYLPAARNKVSQNVTLIPSHKSAAVLTTIGAVKCSYRRAANRKSMTTKGSRVTSQASNASSMRYRSKDFWNWMPGTSSAVSYTRTQRNWIPIRHCPVMRSVCADRTANPSFCLSDGLLSTAAFFRQNTSTREEGCSAPTDSDCVVSLKV